MTAAVGPLDAFIDAGASLLKLPIDPAWKPAISGNLEVTLRLAELVAAYQLPEGIELAPVYRASDDTGT